MIAFEQVSKSYGDFTAVNHLDLTVDKGEVFGFLGPNGAGKTTTIRMMMGILVPSSGHITIEGLDCQSDRGDVKRRVGYLPDNPVFYDYLRGREILVFVGEMHGQTRGEAQRRADALLDELVRQVVRRILLLGQPGHLALVLALEDVEDRRALVGRVIVHGPAGRDLDLGWDRSEVDPDLPGCRPAGGEGGRGDRTGPAPCARAHGNPGEHAERKHPSHMPKH